MRRSDPARRLLLELLRNFRLEAGLTQTALASRLRRPQSFVSKIETGERRLDLVELAEYCRALRVPLRDFVRRFEHDAKR